LGRSFRSHAGGLPSSLGLEPRDSSLALLCLCQIITHARQLDQEVEGRYPLGAGVTVLLDAPLLADGAAETTTTTQTVPGHALLDGIPSDEVVDDQSVNIPQVRGPGEIREGLTILRPGQPHPHAQAEPHEEGAVRAKGSHDRLAVALDPVDKSLGLPAHRHSFVFPTCSA